MTSSAMSQRRQRRWRGGAEAAAATRSARRKRPPEKLEATFDHGETDGYGLWLDPAVKENPVYAEHWAGKREVTVRIDADQIIIRRAAPRAGRVDDESRFRRLAQTAPPRRSRWRRAGIARRRRRRAPGNPRQPGRHLNRACRHQSVPLP